jgi:PBP1b-binding outer membrane lipoprotein LpoB
MKKIVVLIVFAAFLTACSQYTCPTYSKKEAPKKATSEKRM